MGGGIVGWLTPGWMTYEKSLSPHIATPSIYPFFCFILVVRLREADVERWREPKDFVD